LQKAGVVLQNSAMEDAASSQEETTPEAAHTLGDVLYADRMKVESEEVWVGLVRAMAGGDQLALHALYERAHRFVLTLGVRITGNRETAEEVTLDVFHDAWRRASGYDPANGTVLGWIMNQARSRAIDRVRFERRKKRVDPECPAHSAEADGSADVLEMKQEADQLQDALGVLTPHERQAIETAYFADLSYTDAAAQLNEPVGTVKTRIRSGLRKLRATLGKRR